MGVVAAARGNIAERDGVVVGLLNLSGANTRRSLARDELIKPKANKVTMGELFDAVVADYEKRDNRSGDTLVH